jgi:hypothetical protein
MLSEHINFIILNTNANVIFHCKPKIRENSNPEAVNPCKDYSKVIFIAYVYSLNISFPISKRMDEISWVEKSLLSKLEMISSSLYLQKSRHILLPGTKPLCPTHMQRTTICQSKEISIHPPYFDLSL